MSRSKLVASLLLAGPFTQTLGMHLSMPEIIKNHKVAFSILAGATITAIAFKKHGCPFALSQCPLRNLGLLKSNSSANVNADEEYLTKKDLQKTLQDFKQQIIDNHSNSVNTPSSPTLANTNIQSQPDERQYITLEEAQQLIQEQLKTNQQETIPGETLSRSSSSSDNSDASSVQENSFVTKEILEETTQTFESSLAIFKKDILEQVNTTTAAHITEEKLNNALVAFGTERLANIVRKDDLKIASEAATSEELQAFILSILARQSSTQIHQLTPPDISTIINTAIENALREYPAASAIVTNKELVAYITQEDAKNFVSGKIANDARSSELLAEFVQKLVREILKSYPTFAMVEELVSEENLKPIIERVVYAMEDLFDQTTKEEGDPEIPDLEQAN